MALHRLFERAGFVLFERLQVIQPLEKEEVGDLLDDFEGIGDATGPEGIPEGIDFTANFAVEHVWYWVAERDEGFGDKLSNHRNAANLRESVEKQPQSSSCLR